MALSFTVNSNLNSSANLIEVVHEMHEVVQPNASYESVIEGLNETHEVVELSFDSLEENTNG